MFLQFTERILSVVGGINRIHLFEMSLHKLAHVFIIIHNQHRRFCRFTKRTGNSNACLLRTLRNCSFICQQIFLSNSFFFLHHLIRLLNHSIQLVERQGYDKGRSLTYCRFYFNHTMMSLNEILHDVETDSGSRFVVACLIEGSEDFLLFVRTDSQSVVFHLYAEMVSILQQAAGQTYIILGIFQGVGHQIADNLGNGLLVNHRHELFGWIIYIKTNAFLLEGRSKALCHSMHQLRNVVQTEMNLHALLLHFVEIEQLIY